MKAVALTINVIGVIAIFFFLWSSNAQAQTLYTFTTGNTVTIVDNSTVELAPLGSLTVFDIGAEIPNINFNYSPPTIPRYEYCSASCVNSNFGVTVFASDSYRIDTTNIADGRYIATQKEPNAFSDWPATYSDIINNNVGEPFQTQESFVYLEISGGKIVEFSAESGANYSPETRNSAETFLNFLSGAETFALRLFLFAPESQTTASFTTPMLASVINGVQTTGGNIWPLFVLAGVPLAFIIALQLIVFTRRSINMRTVEFDNKKADELEDFFSKTGGTKKDELDTIREIERNR